jgi:hypothetical protein
MKCEYDGTDISVCERCPYKDCINDWVDFDPYSEDVPEEQDNILDAYADQIQHGQRKKGKFKGTYFDDERHRKAREYEYRKRHGIPHPPKVYKCKGRKLEYMREYRKNMPTEQKERYLAWQREYARKKRAKIA